MTDKKPVTEYIVSLVQERSAGINEPEAFGACEDMEQIGYESLLPSYSKAIPSQVQPKIKIGGPHCTQPYEASVYNCSALSFGPLSKQFILAMNKAAFECGFYQNTGEAGISPYHFGVDIDVEDPEFCAETFFARLHQGQEPAVKTAGDVVWQLGTGYFGCRREDGSFDPDQFRLKSRIANVKMIELKLSQGVEPRKEMPVKQLTPGIAKLMGISHAQDAKLLTEHIEFSTPVELMNFVARLRDLSGGKPVGLKLGVTHKYWFLAICKAMLKTGILPDFITVDGMEAGTSAASKGASGYTGTPLNESVVFVHNALVGIDVREHIRIIASGRVFTERDIIAKLARGADLCAAARSMLLAVGCDQQRECYKGICQKGIATQDPVLTARFNVDENAARIVNFHRITIQELNELLAIAGLHHPSELGPGFVQRRVSPIESKTLDELYVYIPRGSLLSPFSWRIPKSYRQHWSLADPDVPFSSHPKALSLHR